MTREEEIINKAVESAKHVCFKEQDAFFNVVLLTFKDAAKWADKTMIEKACEWLRTCNYAFPYKMIESFKKAMEE